MATTIEVEPQTFQSAYNEVMVVLDSTNKAEPKFQHVIDINVDGVFSSRLKVQSNPQGFAVVNLSKHLEPYVTSNIDIADKELFKKITDSYTKYDIDLSEEYVLTTSFTSVTDNGGFCQYNYASPHNFIDEDFVTVTSSTELTYLGVQEVTSVPSPSAIVTTTPYVATATGNTVLSNNTVTIIPDAAAFTGDKYVTNNVEKWVDVPNWDATDYNIDSANEGKMLTNLPSTFYTELDDRITMNFYNGFAAGEATHLQLTNSNGNTFFYDNINPIAGVDSQFMSVSVGAFDVINAPLSGTAVSSTSPVIESDTTFYTVKLVDSTFKQSSEEYTFNITRNCDNYEGFRLMYLNRGGSYSSFNFGLAHNKSVSNKKTKYQQNYGTYNSALNTYGWDSSDRGSVVLDTDITETYTINSDYVDEVTGNTIEDLIISPEVYHLSDNTYAYDTPVTVSNIIANGILSEVQCAAVHGLVIGDTVRLDGFNVDDWNKDFCVTEIVSTTNFVIEKTFINPPFTGGGEIMEKRIFGADGILRAIDIKTSTIKIKRANKDKLINYTIGFNYATKNTVQR